MKCLRRKRGTSAASCKFAVDIHEVGEILGLLVFGGIGSFLGRVQHREVAQLK